MSLSWVGPTFLAGTIAYVFHLNHTREASGATAATKPLVSTTSFAMMVFVVYAMGALPRNRFFPAWWYRGNLFRAMYKYLYCSETVGYNVLKRLMHQPQPYPHSDFRGGIRTLTEVCPVAAAAGAAAGEVQSASSSATARLGENLQRWRPPCLDDAAATESASAGSGAPPAPRSAAAVAAAALEKLKRSARDSAAHDNTETPPLFALRGGLPVDVQKLKFRKSDRHVLVFPIPIFSDNYSYLIFSCRTKKCCLVDPADPIAAMRCILYLKKNLYGDERTETDIKITDVLTTHKHWDHAGGNKDLYEYAIGEENREKAVDNQNVCDTELNIYGPAEESTHFVNKTVSDGDTFNVCGGAVRVDVLSAPGHTHGSLLFVVSDARAERNHPVDEASIVVKNKLAVFTGDALFSGGLGAPFETDSIAQIKKTRSDFLEAPVLRAHPVTAEPVAPEDVLLYVGHEYTERLVEEMYSITTRVLDAAVKKADENEGSESHDGAQAYLRNLAAAKRDVKILRAQTDGLEDARSAGDDLVDANKATLTTEEKQRQRKLRNRIPLCTVPTTLALEIKINPLLTMKAEVLDTAVAEGAEVENEHIEKAIYLTLDRVCE